MHFVLETKMYVRSMIDSENDEERKLAVTKFLKQIAAKTDDLFSKLKLFKQNQEENLIELYQLVNGLGNSIPLEAIQTFLAIGSFVLVVYLLYREHQKKDRDQQVVLQEQIYLPIYQFILMFNNLSASS